MDTSLLKLSEGNATRLFGANMFFDVPGAVHDVQVTQDQELLVQLWYEQIQKVLSVINWGEPYQLAHKRYTNGIRFALTAPIDILWSAVNLLETVWLSVRCKYELGDFLSFDEIKNKLDISIENNINLQYRRAHKEAMRRGINIFESNGKLVIGSGKNGYHVSFDQLKFEDIPWDKIADIPFVLVTGTNGKTTTVRLTRFINKFAGLVVGYCCSDWVMIGDEIIEEGDLSGPSGNQSVMMNPKVDVAVLEVARGGLVRRGLLTVSACGAVVTNISDDHLGIEGIDTLNDLAEAKSLVYKGIAPNGYAIFNLDDESIQHRIKFINQPKILFTKDIHNPKYSDYLKSAEHICYVEHDAFYFKSRNNDSATLIGKFSEIPITVNGYAIHNIENTMAAICLSFVLGRSLQEISAALKHYENSAENNQGRANVFEYNGGKIIVDFAHNIAGITAILHLAKSYVSGNGRLGILFGNTGDRKKLAPGIADSIIKAGVDYVVLKELSNHLRGTKPGELVEQMRDLLIQKGMSNDRIKSVGDELAALDVVLEFIKPGDAFVFCTHIETGEIIKKLTALSN